jgi:copper chaperone CopZ
MTCEMGCARSIEKALSEVPGVSDIKVDFNSQKARLSFNTQLCDQKLLVQTVDNLAGGKYKIQDYKKIKPNSKPLGSTIEMEEMPVKEGSQVHIPLQIPFPNIFDFIELR